MDFRETTGLVSGKRQQEFMEEIRQEIYRFRANYSKTFQRLQQESEALWRELNLDEEALQVYNRTVFPVSCEFQIAVEEYCWVQGLLTALDSRLAAAGPIGEQTMPAHVHLAECALDRANRQFAAGLPEGAQEVCTRCLQKEKEADLEIKAFAFLHGYEWGHRLLKQTGDSGKGELLPLLYQDLE